MNIQGIVNSIMSSMTYVLSEDDCDGVWLVDCGDINSIQASIGSNYIKGVLLTHAHYDHIYGLPFLLSQYPDCVVLTNKAGEMSLASAKLNLSKYQGAPIEISASRIQIVSDGDVVKLFPGYQTRVFETPGHNPSCLCFQIEDILFTGDAYIPGLPVVTNLPGGNKEQANVSKLRIESMISGRNVYPGHFCR